MWSLERKLIKKLSGQYVYILIVIMWKWLFEIKLLIGTECVNKTIYLLFEMAMQNHKKTCAYHFCIYFIFEIVTFPNLSIKVSHAPSCCIHILHFQLARTLKLPKGMESHK